MHLGIKNYGEEDAILTSVPDRMAQSALAIGRLDLNTGAKHKIRKFQT